MGFNQFHAVIYQIAPRLLYFSGSNSPYVTKWSRATAGNGFIWLLVKIGILSGLVIPTDPIYRMAFSKLMTTESGLNLSASSMLVYSILYIMFFLGIAIRHFDRKDL